MRKDSPRVIAFEGTFSKEGLRQLKDWWQKNHKWMIPIIDLLKQQSH